MQFREPDLKVSFQPSTCQYPPAIFSSNPYPVKVTDVAGIVFLGKGHQTLTAVALQPKNLIPQNLHLPIPAD
ncbi:hypothetical protein BCD67_07760 [Oscillatoriales cyanobacterium USR001]|nr:hypothetical protein BCD67_07760 [Oscillatoriales cyanobacterium USR001]